ncbi:MAG: hypothetical protein [Caudoviricetes sp.]|nr:MAG: hypothetical protein [Caudoviricetes sp.]
MSLKNLFFEVSSKNVTIVYTRPGLKLPIVITGSGIGEFMEPDVKETSVGEVATDGSLVGHVQTTDAKATGTFTLNPYSPGAAAFYEAALFDYNLGFIVPGTLMYVNPLALELFRYQNFFLNTPFTGLITAEKIKDQKIKYTASLPNTMGFASLAAIETALANFL